MNNPNCNICSRRNHCYIKEFEVLSCEDYKPEVLIECEEKESDDV